jgi:hypothetical protein
MRRSCTDRHRLRSLFDPIQFWLDRHSLDDPADPFPLAAARSADCSPSPLVVIDGG